MQIFVTNVEKAKEFSEILSKPLIVISMGEPGREYIKFNAPTLYIDCHDIDAPRDGLKLFSEEDANKIWDFTQKHVDANNDENTKILNVLVHCNAGMSRSPAIAFALSEIYTDDKTVPKRWMFYNRHIFATMMQKFRKIKFID